MAWARLRALRLSAAPDLGAPRALALTALAVAAVVAMGLVYLHWTDLGASLGDTDDATRMILVRQLMQGGGWWSQHFMRYQPPLGVYMHWSRLLDGGIAALNLLFRLVLGPGAAETATRLVWPLLWLFPAILATLTIARRLGLGLLGNGAVAAGAVILMSNFPLYIQFRPGRIDHHDVQMTLSFLALAGATQRTPAVRGAILAGIATGIGLAIGLEGLVFDAMIGAGVALRFVADPRDAAAARAYALALLTTTVLAFAVQTPPWRWGAPACDALAVNLLAAIATAAVGLYLVARLAERQDRTARLALLALAGAAAAMVYLGVYPRCRAGFFADVDPRIRPIWLNYVQEVRSISVVTKKNLAQGVGYITLWSWGLLAWGALGLRRARRRDPAWLMTGACLICGVAAGASLIRASGYAEWFAVPVLAAAAVEGVAWLRYNNWLAVILAAAVASPASAQGLGEAAAKEFQALQLKPKAKAAAGAPSRPAAPRGLHPVEDACFDTASYRPLDKAGAPGLVLSEVDLGPFIVANTPDSVLAAPYHRMGWGILAAHSLMKAPVDGGPGVRAYDRLRAAGVAYVVECRRHANHGDRVDMAKDALQKQLDAGHAPAWLQPLSPRAAPLQAYRVVQAPPAAAAAAAPAPPAPGRAQG